MVVSVFEINKKKQLVWWLVVVRVHEREISFRVVRMHKREISSVLFIFYLYKFKGLQV